MILHQKEGVCKPPGDVAEARYDLPAVLTVLPTWACRRARIRTKNGGQRVVHQPVHPVSGAEPRKAHIEEWASYDDVLHPRLRKPTDGIGVYLGQDSGLAVVLNADPGFPARLGDQVVYAEQSVAGDGLTVVVKAGVVGAVVDRFVPLSGQPPYQRQSPATTAVCLDTARTPSGHPPYQAGGLSGHPPYQAEGACLDTARILLSSSPPEINGEVGKESVEDKLAELAKEVLEQGMSRGTDDNWRWLYSVISLLQVHGVTADEATPHLLRKTAEALGVDADDLQARVVARWSKLDPSRGLLADALRAVQADASLLKDLPLANPNALLVAGMARYMGREGKPFRLHQVSLAQVLGLPGQQAVSPLVLTLREKGWLRLVGAHKYAGPKGGRLAAEYVWTGPGAVEPRPASEAAPATPKPAAVPHPPPRVSVAPPPSPRRTSGDTRPGYSPERHGDQKYESRFGGFLTVDYYLAEVMVARRLKREGKDLYETFWRKDKLGRENEAQAAAARELLKDYLPSDIYAAIKADGGKRLYSLWGGWAEGLVKEEARQRNLKEVLAEREAQRVQEVPGERMEATAEPPTPTPVLQAPRPAFVPRKRSAFALAKESDAKRGLAPCPT